MVKNIKESVQRQSNKKSKRSKLSPEIVAKLQSRGLDPETVTMKQLFPEVLDEGGNDLSLVSGAEWENDKILQNPQVPH